jgi:hypothetical protein
MARGFAISRCIPRSPTWRRRWTGCGCRSAGAGPTRKGRGLRSPSRTDIGSARWSGSRRGLKHRASPKGPVFRRVLKGGRRVGDTRLIAPVVGGIVKRYARLADLDDATFAGHSLRAGFLTSAAESGASLLRMADQSRHGSLRYSRPGTTLEGSSHDRTDLPGRAHPRRDRRLRLGSDLVDGQRPPRAGE